MYYQIKQIDKSDCGFACLKIILAHFHRCSGFLFIDNKYRKMNFFEIKNELEKNYISCLGIKINNLSLLKKRKFLIVQIKENETFHFVIFIKQVFKYVIIFDPKIGKRILKLNYFGKIFTCNLIMVKRKIRKVKIKAPHFIEFPFLVSYLSSICIDFGFIYLLTYFVNSRKNSNLLVLISIAILLNFGFKIIILFVYNKKLDNKYLDELIKNRIGLDEIEVINTLKINKVNIFKNIGQLFIAVFIAYVLLCDNYLHSYFLLMLLLIMTLGLLVGDNILLIIKEQVSQFEKSYALNPSNSRYKKLKKKSFVLASYLLLSKLGLVVIIGLFALCLFIFKNETSFTYLMFCFFTYYSFYLLLSESIKKFSQNFLDMKSSYCKYLKIKDKYK